MSRTERGGVLFSANGSLMKKRSSLLLLLLEEKTIFDLLETVLLCSNTLVHVQK